MATFGAIDIIWAAPAEDFIPAFGEDTLVAFTFGPVSELVVVGELGVAEDAGSDAEQLLDFQSVKLDLGGEFITVVEEGQRVIISLTDDFDLAGLYHTTDLIDKFGGPRFGLFEPSAGNTEGEFEMGELINIMLEEI